MCDEFRKHANCLAFITLKTPAASVPPSEWKRATQRALEKAGCRLHGSSAQTPSTPMRSVSDSTARSSKSGNVARVSPTPTTGPSTLRCCHLLCFLSLELEICASRIHATKLPERADQSDFHGSKMNSLVTSTRVSPKRCRFGTHTTPTPA